ncbi:hypothetical protein [Flammeovirga aprica]|uniref:Uncharacterized protein n=1 Tax=Flammeovirga aprica JL-4 TaxID=694437 RepID=A0A7X9X9T6_9BACT|nr:hypothetical protein [Flammeovirga aprica]NME69029.1 hypothetical protein [Flammeovirga aprica JL-4]
MKRAFRLEVNNALLLKEVVEKYISSFQFNLEDVVVVEWYQRSVLNKIIFPDKPIIALKLSEVIALKEVVSKMYTRLHFLDDGAKVEILNWFNQLQTIIFNEGVKYQSEWKTA